MVQAYDPSNSSSGDRSTKSLKPAWDSYLKKQIQKPKQLDRSCSQLERDRHGAATQEAEAGVLQ